jgi:hypothetical protein
MKKQQLYVYSNYLLSEIWRCILKKYTSCQSTTATQRYRSSFKTQRYRDSLKKLLTISNMTISVIDIFLIISTNYASLSVQKLCLHLGI